MYTLSAAFTQNYLGAPKYDGNFNAIIEQAKYEANLFKKHKMVNIHTLVSTKPIRYIAQINLCLAF